MKDWANDPDLLATFRAEVDDRLASLRSGLLELEGHPSPRQIIGELFRDAHTVKGSARMLGLDDVVSLAHRAEDLLGALRDGRTDVRRDHIDVLLATCDAISRAMPGSPRPATSAEIKGLSDALHAALRGQDHVAVPVVTGEQTNAEESALAAAEVPAPAASVAPADRSAQAATGSAFSAFSVFPAFQAPAVFHAPAEEPQTAPSPFAAPSAPSAPPAPPAPTPGVPAPRPRPAQQDQLPPPRQTAVRVPVRRVRELLDGVGEAELAARRVGVQTHELSTALAAASSAAQVVRGATSGRKSDPLANAASALVGAVERMRIAAGDLPTLLEDAESAMSIVRDGTISLAMVPVRQVVAGFAGLVRELTIGTGKDVVLVVEGETVELDSRVLDAAADALRHLVTNAVDHGCESVADRIAAGKPGTATITVAAHAAGASVVIDVSDDGAGIDEDRLRAVAVARGVLGAEEARTLTGSALLRVLFVEGFSTRNEVTHSSGRGVGLDVVAHAVGGIGGTVDIGTRLGSGTTFTVMLPVTLGVQRCLVARVGGETYALPVTGVVETVTLKGVARAEVAGVPVLVRHGVSLPLLDLGVAVGVRGERNPRAAVIVRSGAVGEHTAFAVDALDGEREMVIKDLGLFLGRQAAVTGATIDADGGLVLVLDVRELASRGATAPLSMGPDPGMPALRAPSGVRTSGDASGPARILVVEDSVGVRELQRAILEGAGYDVTTAMDGSEGAARLSGRPFDLVLSDVEMPGMDGFSLARALRRTPGWQDVPVIIMTSRGDDADRRAGLDAGASAYLLKSSFDQAELLSTVRRLIGR